MGHAILFNFQINGQEMIVIFQNTHYLAQLITEGMRLARNNYLNQVWLNNILHPLAPSLNSHLVHAMRNQWNMPPFQPYTTPESTPNHALLSTKNAHAIEPHLDAIREHTTSTTSQMDQQQPPPQPQMVHEPEQEEPAMEEIGIPLNLGLEQILEFSNLDEVKLYLLVPHLLMVHSLPPFLDLTFECLLAV